ncbi:MAG: hypothetical protein SFU99_01725 [Saprospiraceae bacterium]|nr:hypothetical protein [Saprospiraceae bacterium]
MSERSLLTREIKDLFSNEIFSSTLEFEPPPIQSTPIKSLPKLEEEHINGHTCYVEIDLGLDKEENKKYYCYKKDKTNKSIKVGCLTKSAPKKMTAIYVPENFNNTSKTDIIIYLHGHLMAHPGMVKHKGTNEIYSPSIKEYLNYKKKDYFNFRKIINEANRNVVFVAPTLSPLSKYGSLVEKFDYFIEQVITAINEYIIKARQLQGQFNLGNIIIAAHSGGGTAMLGIAKQKASKYAIRIKEFWGFDSWYNYQKEKVSEKRFTSWDKKVVENKSIYAYYFNSKYPPKASGKVLVEHPYKRKLKLDHFTLLPYYFKERLSSLIPISPMPINKKYENLVTYNNFEWEAIRNSFDTQRWELAPNNTEREKEFKKRMYKILENTKIDPDKWFDNFTQITFLGRKFNNPIHIEFATYLKAIEKKLATKYGNNNPKKAGDLLNLTNGTLSGGRRESSTASKSMHTFGLAMDINYQENPYLGGKIKNGNTLLALEKAGYIKIGKKRSFDKMDILDKIFNRMGLLVTGFGAKYPRGYHYNNRLDLYDRLYELNKLTIRYFNLLDKPAELEAFLQKNQSIEWKNRTLLEATAIIKIDFDWFRNLVSRYTKKTKDPVTKRDTTKKGNDLTIKKSGFLNLDKRLVEEIELDWGATYGDIMHFDMRNTGVGKRIAESR